MKMKYEYTFETLSANGQWIRSTKRFPTLAEAKQALNVWLDVSAENGLMVAVRLTELENNAAN